MSENRLPAGEVRRLMDLMRAWYGAPPEAMEFIDAAVRQLEQAAQVIEGMADD